MKIVVIDDDRLVSASLKTIIEKDSEIQVVGIGHNGMDAMEMFERQTPDILLMDIRMDGMTGLEAGEAILNKHSHAKILFLTTFVDDEYVVKALKIGAKGYLLKQNFESIIPSLKAVNIGQSVFGDEIIAKIPLLISGGDKLDLKKFDISEKESEIIRLISEGLSNREIATSLFLGEGTVRNNISVILEKLHLRGRTQLAIFYYKNK